MEPYDLPKKYRTIFKKYCDSMWGRCGTRSDCFDCKKTWLKYYKLKNI